MAKKNDPETPSSDRADRVIRLPVQMTAEQHERITEAAAKLGTSAKRLFLDQGLLVARGGVCATPEDLELPDDQLVIVLRHRARQVKRLLES